MQTDRHIYPTLILTNPKTQIDRADRALILHRPHQPTQLVPLHQLDRLILIGSIPLRRPVHNALIRHRVALLQLDALGNPLGSWHPDRQPPQPRRDTRPRLDRAQTLLHHTLTQSLGLLERLAAIGATPTVSTTRRVLTVLRDDLHTADNLDTLRGYTHTATRYHDRALHEWLAGYAATLNDSRPIVPTATALRFAEALLYDDLDRAIARAALPDTLATLHDVETCIAPLVCDGVLLLRCTWVDWLVVRWLTEWAIGDDLEAFLGYWLAMTADADYGAAMLAAIAQLGDRIELAG